MHRIIEQHRQELQQLCGKYKVRNLELFGSAISEDFDPDKSDLDFLVTFEELPSTAYADTYFGLLEELETLFGSQVDLVMESAVDNPYFAKEIEQTKIQLYAA